MEPGVPGDSRSRQITNLDFDPDNILGSWAPSTDSFGMFAPLGSGEQIALTSMQRWTGDFTGVLLYGDFALRYVPTRIDDVRSGLVITSNIDFLNALWADLGNASVSFDQASSTLSITGDLLIGGGLAALDPEAIVGTKFGDFAMHAVIPEPSTWILLGLGALLIVLARKRQRVDARANR